MTGQLRTEDSSPALRGPSRVEPLTATRIRDAAEFLHEHLNDRVSVEAWDEAIRAPWQVDPPNHGVLAIRGGKVIGVYLAFYSARATMNRRVRVCNLAAWCVLESDRSASLRLLHALLAQPGFVFTDLSPSGNVIRLNSRLGFRELDTTTALVPNVVWARRDTALTGDLTEIEYSLSGTAYEVFMAHRSDRAVEHLLITRRGSTCHVMYRRDRRKGLPLFATILYASDTQVLEQGFGSVRRHLALRRGIPFTLAELRIVGHRPRWSIVIAGRPKMYRGDLSDDQVDYLYSELTRVPW